MPVSNPRKRLVYFRLSEEEYLRFQQICERKGGRSLSDFARSAVLQTIGAEAPAGGGGTPEKLQKLDDSLRRLKTDLNRLTLLLKRASETASASKQRAGGPKQEGVPE